MFFCSCKNTNRLPVAWSLPLSRGGLRTATEAQRKLGWERKLEFPWPRHCFPNIPRRSFFSLTIWFRSVSLVLDVEGSAFSLLDEDILFYLDRIDRDRHRRSQIVSRCTDYSYEIRIDAYGSQPGNRRTDEPTALEAKRNSEEDNSAREQTKRDWFPSFFPTLHLERTACKSLHNILVLSSIISRHQVNV